MEKPVKYNIWFYLWGKWTFWPRILIVIALGLLLWFFAVKPIYFWLTAVPAPTDHSGEIAKLEGEKAALKAENEKLRKERDTAMQSAEVEKAARIKFAEDVAKGVVTVKQGADIQKKAIEDYEKKVEEINQDVPTDQRCFDTCTMRAGLGAIYACKPDINTYCRERATR
jgi:hypothetical protein